jgi:broad specificity phosphatase PhoE
MKPKRIILIRHGESEGQVNKDIYSTIPDYALRLTGKGIEQAKILGYELSNIIKNDTYGCYYSPFFRSRETMDVSLNIFRNNPAFNKPSFLKEEPRLREQEWSNSFRKTESIWEIQKERDSYSSFYYRFNGGESGGDCYDRVSDYCHTMHRDFKNDNFPTNCLIYGHGYLNRIFLMRWLHWTVEQFETISNPKNCEYWILERNEYGKYELTNPVRTRIVNHKFKY